MFYRYHLEKEREVYRVLKKNGCFFVPDPCPNDCDNIGSPREIFDQKGKENRINIAGDVKGDENVSIY